MKIGSIVIAKTNKDQKPSSNNVGVVYLLGEILKYATGIKIYQLLTNMSLTSDLADVSTERPTNNSVLVFNSTNGKYEPIVKELLFNKDTLHIYSSDNYILAQSTKIYISTTDNFTLDGSRLPIDSVVSIEMAFMPTNSLVEHTFMLDNHEITLTNGHNYKKGRRYISKIICTKKFNDEWIFEYNEKIAGHQYVNITNDLNYDLDRIDTAINMATSANASAKSAMQVVKSYNSDKALIFAKISELSTPENNVYNVTADNISQINNSMPIMSSIYNVSTDITELNINSNNLKIGESISFNFYGDGDKNCIIKIDDKEHTVLSLSEVEVTQTNFILVKKSDSFFTNIKTFAQSIDGDKTNMYYD